MNRLEESLVLLTEECSEVIKEATKTLRFGLDSTYTGKTNKENLETEIGDLIGVIHLIIVEAKLGEDTIKKAVEKKFKKLEKYMVNKEPK